MPTENPTPAESAPSPTAQSAQAEDVSGWWNDVVFYEIFVRSFKDSDGDGIGDFQGIIQQLDYLNDGNPETKTDLGIGALWLMPINPSPSYHGYDVTDYKAVNPDYGTLDDFKQLLEACHARGIRVIMDFVVNHTSTQHPWFKAAAPNTKTITSGLIKTPARWVRGVSAPGTARQTVSFITRSSGTRCRI